MKKIAFTLIIFVCFYSCTKKCGECFVVEFEANGTTIKSETLMGEYCGSDAKVQAGEDATTQGITCNNCQVQCR